MKLDLANFDAVTFDFFGTIVNWESDILGFLSSWLQSQRQIVSDKHLLEIYDRLRQPIQNGRPAMWYPDVLRYTLDAIAAELECELPSAIRDEFAGISVTHQPFTDSLQALNVLRSRGMVLGALSNIDEASFADILDRIGLSFDVTVTAQRVGAYKPDKAHFMTALSDLQALGINKERVLHVAQSKRADIVPATKLGLACVWVDRPGHVLGRRGSGAENVKVTYTVSGLAELLEY